MDRVLLGFSALMLSFAQAGAQEWQQFGIERFGFVFDVPPEFELLHRSEDGDGAAFHSPDGALLAVWGINVAEGDFLPQVKKQISQDEKEGWKFTYQRLTPEWASYSGIKDDQIRYVRGITVCGDRAAMFLMDYSRDQKVAYDPVVTRMVRSLKPEDCWQLVRKMFFPGTSDGTDPFRETHDLIASDMVVGTNVYDVQGNHIGQVEKLILEKRGGRVSYAVLSFGGFLGIGDHHYPLPWQKLDHDESLGGFRIDVTKEQVEGAPRYARD